MVVLEGELWDAHLQQGSMDALEADAVIVSLHYESPTYKNERLLIPIIRSTHFETFIERLDRMLESMGVHFQGHPDWFPAKP